MNNQTNSTNLVQKYTQTEYCFEIDRIPISKITSNNLKPKGINDRRASNIAFAKLK